MKRVLKVLLTVSFAVLTTSIHADVREGLVAYWPMDTASGAYPMTTPDVVAGNDLSGPLSDSSTAIVAGHFGSCVSFSAGDYLYFTNAAGTDSGLPVAKGGSWSCSLWVNGPSGQASQTTYFGQTSGYSDNWRFSMESDGTTKTRYFIRDGNNSVKASHVGSTNTLDGTWHFIAYTYEASNRLFTVYVDGQPDYTTTFTYGQNDPNFNQVGIGALVRTSVGMAFYGSVDDVALWARALSQSEVQDVMSNSISTPVPAFAPAFTVEPQSATGLYPGDNYTLNAAVYGTRPLYYQWLKNGTNLIGATSVSLPLSSVTTNDNGSYELVVSNSVNTITSTVARVFVNSYGSPNLTNGMVAYWPCDTISGVKTPDVVSGYDMTVNNMGSSNVVAGKWGNALSFDAASSQFARYIANPGDAVPIYSSPEFTVSIWAKAMPTAGSWVFTESRSDGNNNTAFCLGMLNSSSVGFDTFVRDDYGQPSGSHYRSSATFWDDTWHNAVWVQHDAGGVPVASLYIDGVLDPVTVHPVYPVTPNNTALGAFARATPGQFFTGDIDDVALWNRPLSPSEIAQLQTGPITNWPTRFSPLAINRFKVDLSEVAQGDSTILRWDVPANANQILLSGVGDVTAQTVSGIGTSVVTPDSTTNYVLTVIRDTAALGHEVVMATNLVSVVAGVSSNWTLLDNFDAYSPGALSSQGPWIDMYGTSVQVVTQANSANRLAKTSLNPSGAYLVLNGALPVVAGQTRTLFFRMIPLGNPVDPLTHVVGLTDKHAQFYYQLEGGTGFGAGVYPAINDPSQNPGDWLLSAYNGPYSYPTFATNVLQTGAVYSVWIDVTNVLDADHYLDSDMFSVYLQKEGDASRTLVFSNYISDRDLGSNDPLTGGPPTDNLNRIYLAGDSDTDSALFDDFYLSKSGYNATFPRPFGYTGPAPTLQIQWDGSNWQVVFQGTLQQADAINGTWSDVTSTSPYPVTTTGERKFYRAVNR